MKKKRQFPEKPQSGCRFLYFKGISEYETQVLDFFSIHS